MNTPQNIPTPNLQGIADQAIQQALVDLSRTLKDTINRIYLDIKSFNNLPNYTNNAAAIAAGLVVGQFYRNGDIVQVVHA